MESENTYKNENENKNEIENIKEGESINDDKNNNNKQIDEQNNQERFIRLCEKYGFENMENVGVTHYRYLSVALGVAYGLSDAEIDEYMSGSITKVKDIDLVRICITLGIKISADECRDLSLDELRNYIFNKFVDVEKYDSKYSKEYNEVYDKEKNNECDKEDIKGCDKAHEEELRKELDRYKNIFEKYQISIEEIEAGDIIIKDRNSKIKPYAKVINHILNEKGFTASQIDVILKAIKDKIPEEYILRFASPDIKDYQMEKAIEIYKIKNKGRRRLVV